MPAPRGRASETASRRARGAGAIQRSDTGSDKSSGSDIADRGREVHGSKRQRRNPSGGRKASGSGSGSRQRSGGSSTSDEGQRDDAGRVTIDDRALAKRKGRARPRRPTTESVKRATPPDGSPKNVSDDDDKAYDDSDLSTEDEFGVLSLQESERGGLKPKAIFGRRTRDDSTEYLVRWEERSHVANAWVPGAELARVKPELVANFNATHGELSSTSLVRREWMKPQRIVNVTGVPPTRRLLVKWWGLPYADCTWENVEGHKDLRDLLERYTQFDHENLGRPYTTPSTRSTDYHKPNDVVLSISRWLRATWFEHEGVCLVDNSPDCKHSEIAATFICERKIHHKVNGPTLIIVAEDQLKTWSRDFARFSPDLNVVEYGGSAVCRATVQQHEWSFGGLVAAGDFKSVAQPRFNVLLTTHSTVMLDIVLLRQVLWESVILVESSATLKAEASSLMCRLASLRSQHRLLMFRSADFTDLHVTMNILEFLKRSAESMRNLEARLLNLSREEACMQTAALLAVVTMDYQFCEIAMKDKGCLNGESACMGVLHTARLLDLSEIVLKSKASHAAPANGCVPPQEQSVFPESFDYASSRYVGLLQQLQALHNLYRAPLEETGVTA